MAQNIDSLDSFVNAFFYLATPCFFPECQALRDEFGRLEADLKLKGQNCCGAKADLVRSFSRKVAAHWPPKGVN